MAKLKDVHIDQADLIEYLDTESDFAFELRCLERLTALDFQCQHGGSYTDPVTRKTRQFDLRAQKSQERRRVSCAIECKCLTGSFPLLLMCVPRPIEESFHEVILSYHPDMVEQSFPRVSTRNKRCETVRVSFPSSAYATGAYVGRSCAQVGRNSTNVIDANDAEVFDKWSQALASASDLADERAIEGEQRNDFIISLILPVLVVPDGMLWQANYEANGTRSSDPFQTNRCSFFVSQYYSVGFPHVSLTISHLEFVTLSGLEEMMKNIFNDSWFPIGAIAQGSPSTFSSIGKNFERAGRSTQI